MLKFDDYTDSLHISSYVQGCVQHNSEVTKEFHALKDKTYPYKTDSYAKGSDAQHEHMIGQEWLRKLEACFFGIWKPPAEIVLAKLGMHALQAPGYHWIDGPETGMRLLMEKGKTVYQYLYETLPHFESCPSQYSLIAAHRFCDTHDENFVEWQDRATGNRMYFAASGGYYERGMKMDHDNHIYIPPIIGVYGFKNAKKPSK